jgi:large subunit ribosomal protein L10
MLTREQKKQRVDKCKETIQNSECLLLLDFANASVSELQSLRRLLKETAGASLGIIKKRLLKIALDQSEIKLDPTQFEGQAAAIFSPSDCLSIAGKLQKAVKELVKNKKKARVLGGWNIKDKQLITAEEFETLAGLPSREQLLGQLASMLCAPIRQLMFAVEERGKQLTD